MNYNFWTKTTNFKILGKTIFSKEEVCNETNRDTDFEIIVKQEYFDKEFDLEKKQKKNDKN